MNKSSILNGEKYFSSNGLQIYLVFISARRIEIISNNTSNIKSWCSIGMLQESIKNPHTSDIGFAPK